MRDYVCCLTFNNLAKKKYESRGRVLFGKSGKKKKQEGGRGGGGGGGGGGGALETGVCSLRTYFIVRSFSGTMTCFSRELLINSLPKEKELILSR